MKNKIGEQLYKRIHTRVIIGEKVFNWDFRAPAGRYYTPENIEEVKEKCVDAIDAKFPLLEFCIAEMEPNRFNFICIGNRKRVVLHSPPVGNQSNGEGPE